MLTIIIINKNISFIIICQEKFLKLFKMFLKISKSKIYTGDIGQQAIGSAS